LTASHFDPNELETLDFMRSQERIADPHGKIASEGILGNDVAKTDASERENVNSYSPLFGRYEYDLGEDVRWLASLLNALRLRMD
jgi:hypothetical protein